MTNELKEERQDDIFSRIFSTITWIKNSNFYQNYIKQYPLLSLAFIMIFILSFIPVFTFTLFVLATSIFTVVGFLFIEGTLLTIAIILLSGILFSIGILTAGFTVCMGITWFFIHKIHLIICYGQFFFYSDHCEKSTCNDERYKKLSSNSDEIKK